MDEITVALAVLNPPALDQALRGALGDLVAGLSAAHGQVRVHLTRPATEAEAEQVRQIVTAHDPNALTVDQQRRAEQEAVLGALESEAGSIDLSQPLSASDRDLLLRLQTLRVRLGR